MRVLQRWLPARTSDLVVTQPSTDQRQPGGPAGELQDHDEGDEEQGNAHDDPRDEEVQRGSFLIVWLGITRREQRCAVRG
jgi:hypothetical protein